MKLFIIRILLLSMQLALRIIVHIEDEKKIESWGGGGPGGIPQQNQLLRGAFPGPINFETI